jgi:hypothetical protein
MGREDAPPVSALINPERRALKLSKTSSTVLGASIVASSHPLRRVVFPRRASCYVFPSPGLFHFRAKKWERDVRRRKE